MKRLILLLLMFVILIKGSIAADPNQIISNSEDWRDVYSVTLFGNLRGTNNNFLVSDRHATLILNTVSKDSHIWVISSENLPYMIGFGAFAESRGYSVEEFVYDDVNLELARQLEEISNFIVVDDSYGYNAIAVAPYAIATDSYVLFVDSNNVDEVEAFLDDRGVDNMLVYGHVDREVKSVFEKYNPEIINLDGDRFANNVEIVKKFQEVKHSKQTVLTNGEFIEKEIMSGDEPVMFIGVNNVPDVVQEYISNSEIEVGVLVGNELVSTATFIRRQLGISVFVKFAQGARAPKGAIAQVEALDMFYLPTFTINLEVDSIRYNKATNKLEVNIKNTEDQAAYLKGTYSITATDGTRQTVGDIDAVFIEGNALKTVVYDVDTLEGDISVDIFIIYGESRGSMERTIDTSTEVDVVRVLDNCMINIAEVSYDKRKNRFAITAENTGDISCYSSFELIDVVIAGEKSNFGSGEVLALRSGESKKSYIKVELEEDDLDDNSKVRVKAYYGERENSLVKTAENVFELVLKGADYIFYALIIVIIGIIFLIFKRRKREEE